MRGQGNVLAGGRSDHHAALLFAGEVEKRAFAREDTGGRERNHGTEAGATRLLNAAVGRIQKIRRAHPGSRERAELRTLLDRHGKLLRAKSWRGRRFSAGSSRLCGRFGQAYRAESIDQA